MEARRNYRPGKKRTSRFYRDYSKYNEEELAYIQERIAELEAKAKKYGQPMYDNLDFVRIRREMRSYLDDPIYPELWDCGEVVRTRLAEVYCIERNLQDWLDDSDHVIWDLAHEVATVAERGDD